MQITEVAYPVPVEGFIQPSTKVAMKPCMGLCMDSLFHPSRIVPSDIIKLKSGVKGDIIKLKSGVKELTEGCVLFIML